jgi:hypothetical protein
MPVSSSGYIVVQNSPPGEFYDDLMFMTDSLHINRLNRVK